MKKKRLVVSFELLSFGTKHGGAALLGLKHYRIGDARIFLFSKSLLSSSVCVLGRGGSYCCGVMLARLVEILVTCVPNDRTRRPANSTLEINGKEFNGPHTGQFLKKNETRKTAVAVRTAEKRNEKKY